MPTDPVVIVSCARTPIGGFGGSLASVQAPALGAAAVKAAVQRAEISGEEIEQIFMGCVLPAGLGQAPARQAALGAGLPLHVQATTVNKMCGSGMQAVILAHDALLAGTADVVVAGGMESMSNAPYLLARRGAARIGHDTLRDSLFFDGLEDAYTPGKSMGAFAEEEAARYGFTREQQDAYAAGSLRRAMAAVECGAFQPEMTPVAAPSRSGVIMVEADEQPAKADPARIPLLKPVFARDGSITAASSSSISDGAAALVMTRASTAARCGMNVLARVIGHAACANEPSRYVGLPAQAMRRVLDKTKWSVDDVHLFEVNEAFAVVPMQAMRELGIPHDKVNVNGGACALGHPIGASGARIVVSLLSALQARAGRRGVASLCIGGGEATALAVELT